MIASLAESPSLARSRSNRIRLITRCDRDRPFTATNGHVPHDVRHASPQVRSLRIGATKDNDRFSDTRTACSAPVRSRSGSAAVLVRSWSSSQAASSRARMVSARAASAAVTRASASARARSAASRAAASTSGVAAVGQAGHSGRRQPPLRRGARNPHRGALSCSATGAQGPRTTPASKEDAEPAEPATTMTC
jgi:hypothetical protein